MSLVTPSLPSPPLRCLHTLNLQGLDNLPDIKFICLLLEDLLPELQILGIDYLEPQAVDRP